MKKRRGLLLLIVNCSWWYSSYLIFMDYNFKVLNEISCCGKEWNVFLFVFTWMANKTNNFFLLKTTTTNTFAAKTMKKSSTNKSNIKIAQTNLFNPLACSQTELKINSKTLQNKSSLEIWILQFFRCVQHGHTKKRAKHIHSWMHEKKRLRGIKNLWIIQCSWL